MKKPNCALALLAAVLLAFGGAGCKKEATAGKQPQTADEAVGELRQALAGADPEVLSNLYNGVVYHIRYGQYVQALMAMDGIANDPRLNEPQKKLASRALELLKQAAQNQEQPAKPAQ